jgi:tetratricopeptide (TPR) repeat protein
MPSRLTRWADGLIEAGILLAVILAPLFFNIHSDRVFEPDKLTLIRSIALVMSAAWVGRFIDTAGWRDRRWLSWRDEGSIWRMPFVLPVALLVLVYLLATIFSVTPRVSWAGSYQRLQGTYTTLSYVVIFALAAATIRRREQINRIVTTAIVTSIPISLYGLLQHYALDPLPWGGDTQSRIAGHMGNAIFIAAYLIMVWPLTAVRIVDAFTNILGDEELSYADVVRSSVYIFTLAIQTVAIYWSGSRGPWLGLGVAAFSLVLILLVSLRNASGEGRFNLGDFGRALALTFGVLLGGGGLVFVLVRLLAGSGRLASLGGPASWLAGFAGGAALAALAILIIMAAGRGWRWLWLSWLLLAVAGGAWVALFNLAPPPGTPSAVPDPVQETVEAWRQIPNVGRFGRLLDAGADTGRVRVLIWEGALDLLAPHEPLVFPDGERDPFNFLRPLLGYGPESMYVAYNRFYVPELATLEARNASPDRSHNETFDALVITGALGFLVWQALYLAVFYYGFRWLGVVRSSRDRNLLIALWIGGAIAGALIIVSALGLPYLGVAVPFGSIAGLVVYLIYYALFTRGAAGEADPFHVERLLLLGLVAAIIAHYVEIHFGIAIASTRIHFFLYVALMFLVGYLLPRLREEEAAASAGPAQRRRARRSVREREAGWLGPVLAAAFVLAVITGTLGYEFMNYTQPPDLQITTLEQIPRAGDVLHQAFFVHAGRGFVDSPFIFLVIIMSWGLGALAFLSEMVRQGQIHFQLEESVPASRGAYAAIALIIMLVAGATSRLLGGRAAAAATVSQRLGYGLLLIWAALLLYAALRLFTGHRSARTTSGVAALLAVVLALPVLVAGSIYGWVLLLGGALVLYLLWDGDWADFVTPTVIVGLGSLAVGLAFAYQQAAAIRNAIFRGPELPQTTSQLERVLATTEQFAGFLTLYYVFIFALMLLAAFALARRPAARALPTGSAAGFIALGALLAAAFYLVNQTNLRIVQADIIYKQARPLDAQATQARQPELWDLPIAIYEHAISQAPLEDFYYLFLGRALLEKASLTADPAEQEQLLEEARARLLFAQEINPLNTDHTANLARLTTRWSTLPVNEPAEQAALVQTARAYYEAALMLSPQNSVIRNEYGNLLATLEGDCEAAVATFEESLAIDPYFDNTYLSLAAVYDHCANSAGEATQASYYRRAGELAEEAVARGATRPAACSARPPSCTSAAASRPWPLPPWKKPAYSRTSLPRAGRLTSVWRGSTRPSKTPPAPAPTPPAPSPRPPPARRRRLRRFLEELE